MVRRLLFPLILKFKGLFLSMAFVCFLSVGIMSGLSSAIDNLEEGYSSYLRDYHAPDVVLSLDLTDRTKLNVNGTDGVRGATPRLSVDANLRNDEGRVLSTRILSFEEGDGTLYFHTEPQIDEERANVFVSSRYAKNNGIEVGENVELGYSGCFFIVHVAGIVDSPETLYARSNGAIWSDEKGFGLVYIEEEQIEAAVEDLAKSIDRRCEVDKGFKEKIDEMLIAYLDNRPSSVASIAPSLAVLLSLKANELLVYSKEGQEEKAKESVESVLWGRDVSILSSSLRSELAYDNYITGAITQLRGASLYLPILFCFIAAIIIAVFTNQIISEWTREIGILSSIGISKKEMLPLFSAFSLAMCLFAGILGTLLGLVLSYSVSGIFIDIYAIPVMGRGFRFLSALVAEAILLGVGQVATMLTCLRIFSISPVEAISNNENKKGKNPRWADRLISASPRGVALSISSILRGKGRHIASTIAVFASFSIILISSLFYVSKEALVKQTSLDRLCFDCQVYMGERMDDTFFENLSSQGFVLDATKADYGFLEVETDKGSDVIETIGLFGDTGELVYIPSISGMERMDYPGEGLVLPTPVADRLGVKVGDFVDIYGSKVMVSGLSRQYFHYLSFLDAKEMEEMGVSVVSTFFLNINDKSALDDYLTKVETPSLTVYSSSLYEDLSHRYGAIDALLIVLMVFSLAMSFTILLMMTLNSLLEQKRSVSIMRSLGMGMGDVSQSFLYQNVAAMLPAFLIGVPFSIGVASFLLKSMSSSSLTYPLVLSPIPFLLSFGFVVLIVLLSLLASMGSVMRWNISDNLRAKE